MEKLTQQKLDEMVMKELAGKGQEATDGKSVLAKMVDFIHKGETPAPEAEQTQ